MAKGGLLVPVLGVGLQLLGRFLHPGGDGRTNLLHLLISVNHLVDRLQDTNTVQVALTFKSDQRFLSKGMYSGALL